MARSRKNQPEAKGGRSRGIKVLMVALVLGGFGTAMYFAGQVQLFQPQTKIEKTPEQVVVAKKPVASKPQRAFGAVLADMENAKGDQFKYTFFDILGDSGMNRYVDLNGNIVEKNVPVKMNQHRKVKVSPKEEPRKIQATLEKPPVTVKKAPAPSLKIKKAKPSPVPAIKKPVTVAKETVKKSPVLSAKGAAPEQKSNQWVLSSLSELKEEEKAELFWVQVASFKKLDRAQGLEDKLKQNGFFPFIRRIEIKGKGDWHRVYLGKYPSRVIASRYAEMARKKLKLSPVVVQAG